MSTVKKITVDKFLYFVHSKIYKVQNKIKKYAEYTIICILFSSLRKHAWTPWTNDNIPPSRYTHGVIDDGGGRGVNYPKYPRKIKKALLPISKISRKNKKGTI